MVHEWGESALRILESRYLRKNDRGIVIERPEEMFERVARHVAGAEKTFHEDPDRWERLFFDAMASLSFLPNSPTLMNAGRDLGQLAACFVLPVEDSLESIFEAVKNTALIHQSGGGTGFSFSSLRPKNDYVSTTSGIASGPVSFMEVFNTATDIIKQGGTRRGANMGVLRIDHPDIEEFITVKRNPLKLTSFNLSVGITDEFMRAVEQDGLFGLINPRNASLVNKISARRIFDLIIECIWNSGEPGILFLDEINRHNPTPHLGSIESTNPCGEQPLLPFESCTLGSINLTKMLKKTQAGHEIDWDRLAEIIPLAVRFLDDVVEINRYPLPQVETITRGNRKIGLGIMGFAHMLILMRIPYASHTSVDLASKIMSFIQEKAHEVSCELAVTRGAFPNFPGSSYDRQTRPPMRNATVTTIAPTGSLSLIAGCSSGIEPLFALSSTRIIPGSISVEELDPVFRIVAEEQGFLSRELETSVREKGLLPDDLPLPGWFRDLFSPAFFIPPSQHVRIQGAFQQYTDNAVSKTINLPASVSPDVIRDAILLAYELKCRGITLYRDQSRTGQILTCGTGMPC